MIKSAVLKCLVTIPAVAVLLIASGVNAEVRLQGSGASFPFPIYSKWFKDFSESQKGVRVDYQSKGSGAGIRDYTSGVVDFAASDAAMNDEEISNAQRNAVLLPMTAGEIVLVYNLSGVQSLKLPADVYPAIFAGEITKWNDPKISAANPGVKLPDKNITVVVRSDSSGTTYVFTGHLSAVNSAFKGNIGQSKAPQWPTSHHFIKSPRNDGVTATVKQTPGAIGYVEYGYAKLTNTPVAHLQNKSGKFVAPGPDTGAAALADAPFPKGALPGSEIPDLRAWVFEPEGEQSYPIVTYTWMIFPKASLGEEKAKVARDLIEYCLTEGQKVADQLGYIPLPDSVVKKVRTVAQNIQ